MTDKYFVTDWYLSMDCYLGTVDLVQLYSFYSCINGGPEKESDLLKDPQLVSDKGEARIGIL